MSNLKFKDGDKVSHFRFGDGVILGNYHKRQDGYYYWHVGYNNGTFGYNREASLRIRKNFAELLRDNEVTLEAIDDFVDEWHKTDKSIPVYEYLGMNVYRYVYLIESKTAREIDRQKFMEE